MSVSDFTVSVGTPTEAALFPFPVDAPAQEFADAALAPLTFEQVYTQTFPAVWRLVRRMGVLDTSVDEVVQDVFVVVYRNLPRFNGPSAVKAWVLAITTRVVRNYRRTWRRKGAGYALATVVDDPDLISDPSRGPHQQFSRAEAARLIQRLLDAMDDEKASLFVLVELEGLTPAEIARALGAKVQTIYSRVRAARREFERALLQLPRPERG